MRTVSLARLGSLALAALTAMAAAPDMAHAQQRPDLKIEHGGWWDPNDDRGILLRVTNVGTARASAGKAHVQTLSPGPANVAEPSYPALDPGKSFAFKYQLAASCDGHVVKAGVSATADGEQNYANNFFQGPVCAAKSKPGGPSSTQSGGIILSPVGDVAHSNPPPRESETKIDTELVLRPPHLLLGRHTHEVEANFFRPYGLQRENGGLLFVCEDAHRKTVDLNVPGDAHVGFAYHDFSGCEINRVYELIVNFDLSWLRDFDVEVHRATLFFKEAVFAARNHDGDAITSQTCVNSLGLAPSNYTESIERKELINSTNNNREWAGGGWVVTREISEAATGAKKPLYGFVFHGLDENLDIESDAMCISHIREVRLNIDYTVKN